MRRSNSSAMRPERSLRWFCTKPDAISEYPGWRLNDDIGSMMVVATPALKRVAACPVYPRLLTTYRVAQLGSLGPTTEVGQPYSIASSASASRVGGTVRPRGPRGLEIDHKLELGGRHDGQVSGLLGSSISVTALASAAIRRRFKMATRCGWRDR
jgi:hypothetical protein